MFKKKLELAKQRRDSLRRKIELTKNIKAMEYFQKHWKFREQDLLKNIELYELYEKTRQENILVRLSSSASINPSKGNLFLIVTETSKTN